MKFYRLKDLRQDKDLTQEDIAKVLFTSQRQYSRWETGANETPANILIKLADFYNVSLDYITGRTNIKAIAGLTTTKKETTAGETANIIKHRIK